MATEKLRSLEARLDAYERLLSTVHLSVGEVREAQKVAAAELRAEGAQQREAIRAEADRVTGELLKQAQSILSIAETLNKLQSNVSRYAAGGSLAGAVVLFIAVRALGF